MQITPQTEASSLFCRGALPDLMISALSQCQKAMGGKGKAITDLQFLGKTTALVENLTASLAPSIAEMRHLLTSSLKRHYQS